MSGQPAVFPFHVDPDQFCCACGADDETDEMLVSGFLAFPVITPRSAMSARRICNACLAMLLSAVLQYAGQGDGTAGSELARQAIEGQAHHD